jgi:hypothetical protein
MSYVEKIKIAASKALSDADLEKLRKEQEKDVASASRTPKTKLRKLMASPTTAGIHEGGTSTILGGLLGTAAAVSSTRGADEDVMVPAMAAGGAIGAVSGLPGFYFGHRNQKITNKRLMDIVRTLGSSDATIGDYQKYMSDQQGFDVGDPRDLTADEERQIRKAKKRWWGKTFNIRPDTPLMELYGKPGTKAGLSALAGALLGGAGGTALGLTKDEPLAGLIAGAGVGGLAGLISGGLGAVEQHEINRNLDDYMTRLPLHSDLVDAELLLRNMNTGVD